MEINNVVVAGIGEAINSSTFPMDLSVSNSVTEATMSVANGLASKEQISGHRSFLKTITITADITATKQWFNQWGRYSFSDVGSSQSTMHRLKDMRLDEAYIKYVDDEIIKRMEVLQEQYNDDRTKENLYKLIYSSPVGIELTARITTNYLQERTVYLQREENQRHKLEPEWRKYTKWLESLPQSHFITG